MRSDLLLKISIFGMYFVLLLGKAEFLVFHLWCRHSLNPNGPFSVEIELH
jgi:hypothetical protein